MSGKLLKFRKLVVGCVSTISHNTDMRYMPANCMVPVSSNISAIKKCLLDLTHMGSDYIIVVTYPHLKKFFQFHLGNYIHSRKSNSNKLKLMKIPVLYVSPSYEDLMMGIGATEACLKSCEYFRQSFKQILSNQLSIKFIIHYWDCMAKICKNTLWEKYIIPNMNKAIRRYHVNFKKNIQFTFEGKGFLDGYNYPFIINTEILTKSLESINSKKEIVKIKNKFGKIKSEIYNTKFLTNKKIFDFLKKENIFHIEMNNCYMINTNRKYKKFIQQEFV